MINDLKLLDCTLRDGGYINDWNWGYQKARDIIVALMKARVDVIEVGFLRDVRGYDANITVCNTVEELNKLLPEDMPEEHSMFSAMAMRSNYHIEKLSPYGGTGIEMIRITAHDYDLQEGLQFAKTVKEKGYKVSINPINIMGYSDDEILQIVKEVNQILPYQFSIVDTFGSMKRRDLERIVCLVDHNLDKNIRVALHLHENMSLGCCLAQDFISKNLNRPISIDASLMGIGRMPGNLPVEIMADYLNDNMGKYYDIDYLMDAIQDYIAPLKGESAWGYMPTYFLSARFNLHRNYAEYYLKKGDLTNRDINLILARVTPEKASVFEESYANRLYKEYMDQSISDEDVRGILRDELENKDILILAPGSSLCQYRSNITQYIGNVNPVVISVNFTPENFEVNYTFCSNRKRFNTMVKDTGKIIITSNIPETEAAYRVDYNRLTGSFDQGCNSFIMLLKLLSDLNVKTIAAAGADGYIAGENNYFQSNMRSYAEHGNKFNLAVAAAIKNLGVKVMFITPSRYEE